MSDIRNCQFKFKCPMTWDSLVKTEDTSVRYCSECDKGVHLCRTDPEFLEALKKGWCVALRIPMKDLVTIGEPEPVDPTVDPNYDGLDTPQPLIKKKD
jgi:hypothetical protein